MPIGERVRRLWMLCKHGAEECIQTAERAAKGAISAASTVFNGSGKDEFRMPVLLDINESDSEDEIVAVGTGQFRRKSTAQNEEDFLDEIGADDEPRSNGHAGSKRRRGE